MHWSFGNQSDTIKKTLRYWSSVNLYLHYPRLTNLLRYHSYSTKELHRRSRVDFLRLLVL